MKSTFKTLSYILIGFTIIELFVRVGKFPSYLIPSPSQVFSVLWNSKTVLAKSMLWTTYEATLGLLLALIFSCIWALLFILFKPVEEGARPFLIALQGTPILALAPILNAWFGPGLGSKVASAFVVSFFPLIIGITSGLRSPIKEEIELFRTFGANDWKILWKLRVPRCVPWFFAALKVAVPLSVIGAVVGEFVGSSKGLGFIILSSSYYLMISKMFAGVLCCAALSILLFGLVRFIERKIYFWDGKG